jgi:AraC-like DNA-binding protein
VELCEQPIVVTRPGALVEGKVASHAAMASDCLIVGGPTLAYFRRGEGRVRTVDGEFQLRAGTLISAAPGPIHCELNGEHELVVVAMQPSDARPETFVPTLARQLAPDEGDAWYARLTRIVALADAGRIEESDVAAIKRDLEPLMWVRDGAYAHETLRDVFRIVWQRTSEPLTLATIAASVGYTPNYLTDLSREHTGRSLGKWIADIRMTRARHELETTDTPIADVGAACGYADPAYFSRAFRRLHGMPPAAWRFAQRHPVIVSEARSA